MMREAAHTGILGLGTVHPRCFEARASGQHGLRQRAPEGCSCRCSEAYAMSGRWVCGREREEAEDRETRNRKRDAKRDRVEAEQRGSVMKAYYRQKERRHKRVRVSMMQTEDNRKRERTSKRTRYNRSHESALFVVDTKRTHTHTALLRPPKQFTKKEAYKGKRA